MSAFIVRLRQDAALRARFSQDPRAVLREHGIDPAPFNLPDRLDEAQLERLLGDWTRRGAGSGEGSPPVLQPPRHRRTCPLRSTDRPSLMLQPYHLLYLFPLLAAIKRERLDPNGIAFFPGNNVGYFGPLAETLRYGADRGHVWAGCSAGLSTLGLEADGSVKGCPSLPSADYVRGNVREHSLREIWSRLVAERTASAVELWGFCKTCPFAKRCGGGCTWTSHVLFGRPGNNPLCHSRALALAEAGVVETLEPAEAAPGKPFDFGRYRIVGGAVGSRTRSRPGDRADRGQPGLWSASRYGRLMVETRAGGYACRTVIGNPPSNRDSVHPLSCRRMPSSDVSSGSRR